MANFIALGCERQTVGKCYFNRFLDDQQPESNGSTTHWDRKLILWHWWEIGWNSVFGWPKTRRECRSRNFLSCTFFLMIGAFIFDTIEDTQDSNIYESPLAILTNAGHHLWYVLFAENLPLAPYPVNLVLCTTAKTVSHSRKMWVKSGVQEKVFSFLYQTLGVPSYFPNS